MSDYVQVSTTAPDQETAADLGRSAVKAKLAASAQVAGPVRNMFWHQGEYGEGEEWLVLLKTTAARYRELEAHLVGRHPWGNPEVTAVPVTAGSAPYLEWVARTAVG
jgi:periplasmic divalent cation tolerance protein